MVPVRQKRPPGELTPWVQRYLAGETVVEIADSAGKHHTTVYSHLKCRQIPMRRKGPRLRDRKTPHEVPQDSLRGEDPAGAE
jgi:hypothetical protein